MASENNVVIEVLDESRDEERNSSTRKVYKRTSNELGVFVKAAAIYFQKLGDLMDASNSKRQYGALEDFLPNTSRAHKAALKYISEHSEAQKENERVAKKYLPDSAIDDYHAWLDEADED
jgi:hypothetical protein